MAELDDLEPNDGIDDDVIIDDENDVIDGDDIDPDLNDELDGDEPDGDDIDYEREARLQGWRPEGSKSAKQFYEDGEKMASTQKNKYERQMAQKDREFDERIARMERVNKIALDRQRENIERQYSAAKRNAVEMADVEAYNSLEDAEAKALDAFDKDAVQATPKQDAPKIDPSVIAWRENNAWFGGENDGPGVRIAESNFAISKFGELQTKYPNAAPDAILNEVDKQMRSTFPDLYGATTKRRQTRQITDRGGSRRGQPRKTLPAEARKAGKEFVSEGLFKDMAAYEKSYWETQ